ncbi:hypothetical protein AGMMS49944_03810 [Spirochaetia bacterium]|nr:hypothetical protein AGMMS49944_03810 [Spirochaetia bacterium]
MTADEVQYALTYSQSSPFYIRSHLVVPNVHWGLGFNHELDLLSISMDTHIGTEIEIKVTKADMKRDLEKPHHHDDSRIRQFYYAGPREIEAAFFEFAPPEAGIITISHEYGCRWNCRMRRNAKPRKYFKSFTPDEIMRLLRLGNMRYWSQFHKQYRGK